MFEHGSSCDNSTTACGTYHAHLHVVPIDATQATFFEACAEVWGQTRGSLDWIPIEGPLALRAEATGKDYFYFSFLDSGRSHLALPTSPPSQFFRQVVQLTLAAQVRLELAYQPGIRERRDHAACSAGRQATRSRAVNDTPDAEAIDFAPIDLTDGRELGDPRTRWGLRAWTQISLEAAYLAIILGAVPLTLLLSWSEQWKSDLGLTDAQHEVFVAYMVAWLSGLVGGAAFSMKWLYHTVAKGSWSHDRLLWRLFTPLISATLAFAFAAFIRSGILTILDSRQMSKPAAIAAVSFLVGYFSDNAIAALVRVAERIFGPPLRRSQGTKESRNSPSQAVSGTRADSEDAAASYEPDITEVTPARTTVPPADELPSAPEGGSTADEPRPPGGPKGTQESPHRNGPSPSEEGPSHTT